MEIEYLLVQAFANTRKQKRGYSLPQREANRAKGQYFKIRYATHPKNLNTEFLIIPPDII